MSQITLKQVIDIYNGKTTIWPDETPIRLILRPTGETNTKMLQTISEDMRRAVQNSYTRSGLNMAITDQENADLIERLPGSFGTATLCQIISEKRVLNVLSLNGIKPSVRTTGRRDLSLFSGSQSYYRTQVFTTWSGSLWILSFLRPDSRFSRKQGIWSPSVRSDSVTCDTGLPLSYGLQMFCRQYCPL